MAANEAPTWLLIGLTLILAQPAYGHPSTARGIPAPPAIRHQDGNAGGWCVTETDNFRILHNQPRRLAEGIARGREGPGAR